MVTGVEVATGVVVMVNVALVLSGGIVTLAGTPAAGELLASANTTPLSGAGLLMVTVPVEELPPVRLVGLTENVPSSGGATVRVAVALVAPETAVMTTGVEAATGLVMMVNVTLVLRAGMVTVAGTVAAEESAVSDTTRPPLGAGPFKVTVPLEELPPVTPAGFRERPVIAGGFTVRITLLVSPA